MARLTHFHVFLLLLLAITPASSCRSNNDDFSKKTASIFLFIHPKFAEESAKVIGNCTRPAIVDNLLKSGTYAIARLRSEGKNAIAVLYDEAKRAIGVFSMSKSCPPRCFRADPVCGKDNVTYWCGMADAECAGVEVDHVGYCDLGNKDTGGRGQIAAQSLFLVHMIWLILAVGFVLLGLL